MFNERSTTMFDTSQLKRFDQSQGPRLVGPKDGYSVQLPGVGVRFMAWAEETGGGFSMVEHPIASRAMAAPWHMHTREDEYSYVLEGRMGALLGDDEVYADIGDFVFKPRDQWHTFWNAGDEPCRILEIISPGGFEHMFREMGELMSAPDPEKLPDFSERYGIQFDPEETERVAERFGLVQNYIPDDAPTSA
jgi:mannose-6-phosphate isomerase-like protein (cupin superfamily)